MVRRSSSPTAAIVVDRNHWQQFMHSFVATGATTTLTFRNATALADSQTGLDDISLLAAVPEPGTWVLMLAGISGLIWRRRWRAVCDVNRAA